MSGRSLTRCVLALSCWPAVAGADAGVAPAQRSVIDSIETVDERRTTFLPKYRPEWFVGLGYEGTFQLGGRMWPALALQLEFIFARPGRFDVGLYLDGRWGRPDEAFGRFAGGLGPELMWRFVETSVYDIAAVARGAFIVDSAEPLQPLLRPQAGVQASLVRSLALQLTYDPLISFEREFSTGNHVGHGLSVIFKAGLCPLLNTCAQVHVRPVETLDRSPVACTDAALVCRAARSANPNAGGELCRAALAALDSSRYPADWRDPVGAFVRALRSESRGPLLQAAAPALEQLARDHDASIRGIDDYSERVRNLEPGKALSAKYSYVVTPVMIRDWLGCNANGEPMTCASEAVCACDTGVGAECDAGAR